MPNFEEMPEWADLPQGPTQEGFVPLEELPSDVLSPDQQAMRNEESVEKEFVVQEAEDDDAPEAWRVDLENGAYEDGDAVAAAANEEEVNLDIEDAEAKADKAKDGDALTPKQASWDDYPPYNVRGNNQKERPVGPSIRKDFEAEA